MITTRPIAYLGTSVLIHLGIAAALLAAGVSLKHLSEEASATGLLRTALVSEIPTLPAAPLPPPPPSVTIEQTAPPPPTAATDHPARTAPRIISTRSGSRQPPFALSTGSATFAGAKSGRAKRIAYVIDASGSMVGAFPAVCAELVRSIGQLDDSQEFVVVLFQGGRALEIPPGRAVPATNAEAARVSEWLRREVICTGGSNPLSALRRAMSHAPDVVFLLGSGAGALGPMDMQRGQLLHSVGELNPPASSRGARASVIHTIECLEQDISGAFADIASAHGGTYTYLDRSSLGLQRSTGDAQ